MGMNIIMISGKKKMTIKIPSLDAKTLGRFWSYIDKSKGCWKWTGGTNKDGYGLFSINNKTYRAHRIAYYLYYGQPKGIIMHLCDNPKCCNPKHLSDATQFENLTDMVNKGRQAKGKDINHAKLIDKQVKQIRKMSGSQRKIAKQFGIAQTTISRIKNRKIWTHI